MKHSVFTYYDIKDAPAELNVLLNIEINEVIVGNVTLPTADRVIYRVADSFELPSIHHVVFDVHSMGTRVASFCVMRYQTLHVQQDGELLIFTIFDKK
jgi:hypothetical protein